MNFVLDQIAPYRKAVVAFLATALVGYLRQHGLDLSVSVGDFIRLVIDGAFGAVLVYFTRNQVGAVNRKK